MSSTFLDIKTYDKKQSFKNRLTHNARQKNLQGKDYKYSNADFKNIIFLDKREDFKNKANNQPPKIKTRTELSQEIARYKYKLKKVKKDTTKQKYQEHINNLITQRDNTLSLNKISKPRKEFIELTFSITDLSKRPDLLRNQDYLTDLNNTFINFLKDKLPNLNITLMSGHLDQTTPHIHINGYYEGDNNLTKDLQLNYGKKKQYKDLQRDFNLYIKEQQIFKDKYNLDIKNLSDTSKDYLKLKDFKALQNRAKIKAEKEVFKYLDKQVGINTDTDILGLTKTVNYEPIIEALYNKLVEFYKRDIINKDIPSTADKYLKQQELINIELQEQFKNLDLQVKDLQKDNALKQVTIDQLNKTIKEKEGYTKDQVQLGIDKALEPIHADLNKFKTYSKVVTDFINDNNLAQQFNEYNKSKNKTDKNHEFNI